MWFAGLAAIPQQQTFLIRLRGPLKGRVRRSAERLHSERPILKVPKFFLVISQIRLNISYMRWNRIFRDELDADFPIRRGAKEEDLVDFSPMSRGRLSNSEQTAIQNLYAKALRRSKGRRRVTS